MVWSQHKKYPRVKKNCGCKFSRLSFLISFPLCTLLKKNYPTSTVCSTRPTTDEEERKLKLCDKDLQSIAMEGVVFCIRKSSFLLLSFSLSFFVLIWVKNYLQTHNWNPNFLVLHAEKFVSFFHALIECFKRTKRKIS